MTAKKKQRKPATKKAPAKKPVAATPGPDVTALGRALTTHAAKLPDAAVAAVKTLAAGQTPAHGALVQLRDGINAAAPKLRQNGQKETARELSNLNRLVRRLERAARK